MTQRMWSWDTPRTRNFAIAKRHDMERPRGSQAFSLQGLPAANTRTRREYGMICLCSPMQRTTELGKETIYDTGNSEERSDRGMGGFPLGWLRTSIRLQRGVQRTRRIMGCENEPGSTDDQSGGAARFFPCGLLLHGAVQRTHAGGHAADQARSQRNRYVRAARSRLEGRQQRPDRHR